MDTEKIEGTAVRTMKTVRSWPRIYRLKIGGLSLLVIASLATPALSETFGLFVSGLSGDPKYEDAFLETGRLLYESAIASGMKDENLYWLTENVDSDRRIRDRSTREAVLSVVSDLRQKMHSGDLLWLVLIGHGTYRDGTSKINLPGPDLTDRDLGSALAEFSSDRPLVFVNTASASGGFLRAVTGDGRVVITATKSAAQRNETVFGTFFGTAFSERRADTDEDGFVSSLEAFVYASEEVKRYYEDRNLLVTENALLDDNGDGEGALVPDALGGADGHGDGVLAARLVLGASALTRVRETPQNVAMLERKAALQRKLSALRRQKETLGEDLYLHELQSIVLEIARIDQALRSQQDSEVGGSGRN